MPAMGKPTKVVLPTAQGSPRSVPAWFEVVEAEFLIPSHEPEGFDPRVDYPYGVQERRYDFNQAEKVKVHRIAANMIPSLLANTNVGVVDGTPVADQDNIVLSGNGRAMGIQLAYRRGRTELRAYLLDHAADFGLARAEVEEFKHPVLIRRVRVAHEDRARWVRDANEPLTQVLAVAEADESKARLLPPDVLDTLAAHSAHLMTNTLAWVKAHGAKLVGALERSGFLTSSNRTGHLDRVGGLSQRAAEDVTRILGAAVLPASADGGPDLRRSVERSAAGWLVAASVRGWDFRDALRLAASEWSAMRAAGLNLRTWRAQTGIAGPRVSDTDRMVADLLAALTRCHAKPKLFAEFSAELARAALCSGGSLFTGDDIEPEQALANLVGCLGRGVHFDVWGGGAPEPPPEGDTTMEAPKLESKGADTSRPLQTVPDQQPTEADAIAWDPADLNRRLTALGCTRKMLAEAAGMGLSTASKAISENRGSDAVRARILDTIAKIEAGEVRIPTKPKKKPPPRLQPKPARPAPAPAKPAAEATVTVKVGGQSITIAGKAGMTLTIG